MQINGQGRQDANYVFRSCSFDGSAVERETFMVALTESGAAIGMSLFRGHECCINKVELRRRVGTIRASA